MGLWTIGWEIWNNPRKILETKKFIPEWFEMKQHWGKESCSPDRLSVPIFLLHWKLFSAIIISILLTELVRPDRGILVTYFLLPASRSIQAINQNTPFSSGLACHIIKTRHLAVCTGLPVASHWHNMDVTVAWFCDACRSRRNTKLPKIPLKSIGIKGLKTVGQENCQ
jgi:hypothetical protein